MLGISSSKMQSVNIICLWEPVKTLQQYTSTEDNSLFLDVYENNLCNPKKKHYSIMPFIASLGKEVHFIN